MDLGRIVQMIVNLLVRKAVNRGVKMSIDYASKMGRKSGEAAPPLTAAEQEQAKAASDLAKRARQAARVTRRLGR